MALAEIGRELVGTLDLDQTTRRIVDIVGYGVTPVWEPSGPTQFVFDGKRRSGTSVITGLGKAFVKLNQNRNGIGTGSGLCFGDSGSPQIDQATGLVISVTTGGNGQCNANNKNYRVDTYVTWQTVGAGRQVKLVTVVVRDGTDTSKVWARAASAFDRSTGE